MKYNIYLESQFLKEDDVLLASNIEEANLSKTQYNLIKELTGTNEDVYYLRYWEIDGKTYCDYGSHSYLLYTTEAK